jgi:Spy/CpxP family protein refolding chaperone
MKRNLITTVAGVAFISVTAFAQTPPNPPNPPAPPAPSGPAGRHEDRHEKKVPVTFLGIETSEVPLVVSEQLGLPKGFGLVVDYVVPDGPAAAAGVRQNDILTMLNDQILTDPGQLAKLVRSFSEGTNVTFTVLRKTKEEKITVKLAKKEVPERELRPHHGHGFPLGDHDLGDLGMNELGERMSELKEQLGDEKRGTIHDAVMKAREQVMRAREQAREAGRRAEDQVRILSRDWDAIKSTKIDIGKAQIVCSDDKGELRIENIDGKKILIAKDPKGLLLFSGPVETKEDLDKVPVDVRQRFEKLQEHDLPAVISPNDAAKGAPSTDNDDNEEEDETSSMEEVLIHRVVGAPILLI